jgi:hypothetical protein
MRVVGTRSQWPGKIFGKCIQVGMFAQINFSWKQRGNYLLVTLSTAQLLSHLLNILVVGNVAWATRRNKSFLLLVCVLFKPSFSVERLVHPLFEALFLRFASNVLQYSSPTFHEHQLVRGDVYLRRSVQTDVNSWSVLHLNSYPIEDRTEFNVYGSVHHKNILIYIQQDATLNSLFYVETALRVSGGSTTHYQERIQLYLQHLVFVTPILLSAANGLTNTRCCRYSCLRSCWWVVVPPETCRAVSR